MPKVTSGNACDFVANGYKKGVPMGADLRVDASVGADGTPSKPGAAPSFLVRAARSADGANLDRVQMIKVGNGMEDGVTQGPLINADAIAKVEEHVSDVLAGGGAAIVGGERHALGGTFFQPTVLTGVTADMKIFREETFGPVAPLFKFETEAEVIELANRTEFGLASYFYSRDIGRIFRVSEALEYGMVGVNTGLISTAEAPFGGVKQSGLGREGSHHGIEDYLEVKYICLGDINR